MLEEPVIKPIYQQIAIDIANRIANNEFLLGSRIRGRSTLSSEYNVSPETIRRSITLLQDMNIVEVNQGSGIIVKSRDEAFRFIEKFKDIESVNSIKKDILEIVEKRKKIDEQLDMKINKLMNSFERFKNTNPFTPFEIKITEQARLLGKTLSETKFWQETGATVIGIRRRDKLILSPGPYAVFLAEDDFIFVGEEDSYSRINNILYGDK